MEETPTNRPLGIPCDVVVTGIRQLLTMDADDGDRRVEARAAERQMQDRTFRLVEQAAIAIDAGRVLDVGPERDIVARYRARRMLDAGGRLMTPGLVDAHTHLLYAGNRAHEVSLRARGASYLEILGAGGGILSTVRATQQASDDHLIRMTLERLMHALASGTTTLEIKTGYDLTPAGELRMLALLEELERQSPQRIVKTFMGAHALPDTHRGDPERFLTEMAEVHGSLLGRADFVDIFCEPGVFEREVSRRYLEDALRKGLRVKVHVDELADGGGAAVAAALGAVSADHCAHTGSDGIRALAQAGTVAVLLPGTAGYLHQGSMAPARAMIEAGVPVAIASDGNPGSSPTSCLSTVMPWAASWLRMTPEEVWCGVTTVAAQAVGLPSLGSLAPGKPADFVIWDTDDYRVPCYEYGRNLASVVAISGQVVAGHEASGPSRAR